MKMMNQNKIAGFPIVHGSVMDGDYRYYFMDVAGESLLNGVRNNGPFKTGRILPIALQLLERLKSVHAMGYAMIDLHPGNILLKDRTVFLIDLGLAKRLHTERRASRRSDLLDFILCLEYITTASEYWNVSGPMDLSPWLIPAWRYVDSLGFSGTPNYRHLVSLLRLSARLA
jgi:serine/threonine protein kinase